MSTLEPGEAVDASAASLIHEALPPTAVLAGTPTTALLPLATVGGAEVGLWEMTPGTASDTEADEVFVVISGRATVRFVSPELPTQDIGPGSIVRLTDGMQTEWTVHETLRKVYVA